MNTEWQLQDAKNRLSQVVNEATLKGPQIITVHGKPAAIVLSLEDYQKLTRNQLKLSTFFAESPFYDLDLHLERDSDIGREVEL